MSSLSLKLTLCSFLLVLAAHLAEAGCCGCGGGCCGCCQPCCNCLPCCNPPLLIKLPPTPPRLCPVPCCGCCCCKPCCCCGGRKRREIQLERAHKSYKKSSCLKKCKRCTQKQKQRHVRNAPVERRISPKFVVAPQEQQYQCKC
ncbi:unnamed protein product [Bursaphelenchus okinawaensis]|uniref:Uncharacterized protein n=1 Tax=Bursaphelenchus okinawaensis TaxID=465554 RepID=A0A811KT79_9BILA|nr:unnamed protein product [Bursaphelenchus okinawaensis]CAG9110607.1 unnamed protein product [Bursaphelenchus okinawaensis]